MRHLLAMVLALAACGDDGDSNPNDGGPDAPIDASPVVCSEIEWPAPTCAATDIEGKLNCIPGMQVTRRANGDLPGHQRYDLVFTQPVDHGNPAAGTFQQRLMLLHASPDKPVVLSTSGYGLASMSRLTEISTLFGANQVSYEHRFFSPSRPDPADWTKLDIHQAAMDAHRIAEALHWLYPGKWLNTGASKGGMTSVYQRRFHPCDVDATAAYVAPTSLGIDPSYNTFLEQVGGAARAQCRADLVAFQHLLLDRRAQIVPLVQGSYTQVPVAKAYEMAVIEVNFAFWQYANPDDPDAGCGAIPTAGATDQELLAFMELHSPVNSLAGDGSLAYYRPYYHQAAAQLGAPAPYEAPFAGKLLYPGEDVPASFLPTGEVPAFDAAAMPDVNDWVASEAERIVWIYGELDPWSARPFAPDLARDNLVLTVPGGNHGARIAQLPQTDRDRAVAAVSRWLEATAMQKPAREKPATIRPGDELRPPR